MLLSLRQPQVNWILDTEEDQVKDKGQKVPIMGMVWGAASGEQGGQDIAPHESRLICCLLVKSWSHLHRCQVGVTP